MQVRGGDIARGERVGFPAQSWPAASLCLGSWLHWCLTGPRRSQLQHVQVRPETNIREKATLSGQRRVGNVSVRWVGKVQRNGHFGVEGWSAATVTWFG